MAKLDKDKMRLWGMSEELIDALEVMKPHPLQQLVEFINITTEEIGTKITKEIWGHVVRRHIKEDSSNQTFCYRCGKETTHDDGLCGTCVEEMKRTPETTSWEPPSGSYWTMTWSCKCGALNWVSEEACPQCKEQRSKCEARRRR